MAKSYGIWYVRNGPGPISLAHVRSLCPNKRSVIRIQIGHGGDESECI